MIIIDNLVQVAAQIESERGISQDILFSAIEDGVMAATKRRYPTHDFVCQLDLKTSEIKIFYAKMVVEKVVDQEKEIDLKTAQKMKKDAVLDEKLKFHALDDPDFGRYAAQTAKQVIAQRLREAEKDVIYTHFKKLEGKILLGTVQSVEPYYYLIDLGITDAVLSFKDKIPSEEFVSKNKIKVYLRSIEKKGKLNQINITRRDSAFLKELFVLEIPEIQDGIIEIVSVSRDAGRRSKVAVKSHNDAIGAVGTCVGQMGGRIQSIIEELNKEKIDVLEWDKNPKKFISNALKPAQITEVHLVDEDVKKAIVVVAPDQLSLAIGKQGVNVRLSSQLTGWQLEIISTEEFESKKDELLHEANLTMAERIQQSKQEMDAQDAVQKDKEEKVKLSDIAKSYKLKKVEFLNKCESLGFKFNKKDVYISVIQRDKIIEAISLESK